MTNIITFIYIYIVVTLFDINLKKNGFAEMFKRYVSKYEKLPEKRYDAPEQTNEEIFKLLETIEKACVFYPRNAKCIHKAFISYRYLRKKYGIQVKLIIGVSNFPFGAHAWIKQNEHDIGEYDTEIDNYTIILDSSSYSIKEDKSEVVSRAN
ncbi:lasso peptide biosynthesis B2 protein [Alkalibaculum bacchi]|uniref:lasso peptide biosynthesis B2 protein n=1 Tax=Alkalibaculum bacchi TaxID=645887 RepID=UPI0026EB3622|nr:lasso peptide biosynthesis B2 protein [Alkalibaculum bacchi]